MAACQFELQPDPTQSGHSRESGNPAALKQVHPIICGSRRLIPNPLSRRRERAGERVGKPLAPLPQPSPRMRGEGAFCTQITHTNPWRSLKQWHWIPGSATRPRNDGFWPIASVAA